MVGAQCERATLIPEERVDAGFCSGLRGISRTVLQERNLSWPESGGTHEGTFVINEENVVQEENHQQTVGT